MDPADLLQELEFNVLVPHKAQSVERVRFKFGAGQRFDIALSVSDAQNGRATPLQAQAAWLATTASLWTWSESISWRKGLLFERRLLRRTWW